MRGAVGTTTTAASAAGRGDGARSAPLRVDAQRNLEHVLRAAREVFGELGYGAPMEDVARRARVGVGTVYRRFPSKDVLVRRIAEEETSRLTEQARAALGQEEEPWSALSRFLRTSVASGAGRLLPPQVLRVGVTDDVPGSASESGAGFGSGSGLGSGSGSGVDEARVPQQRSRTEGDLRSVPEAGGYAGMSGMPGASGISGSASASSASGVGGPAGSAGGSDDAGATALLDVVGQLVERARTAGELRSDVSVSDVLLVIATAAPSLPDPAHQAAASTRLLDILLEGLRSRPA